MFSLTLSQFVGLFNILIGLMLTLSVLLLGTGLVVWVIRLGTTPTYRDDAIKMMEWAVTVLFALLLLVAGMQFIQQHTKAAVAVIGAIIVAAVIWAVIQESTAAKAEDKAHE